MIDPLTVRLNVPPQLVSESVDPPIGLLVLSSSFLLLKIQLILEGVDFGPKGKLPFLFLSLLLLLVANEVLDLLVLLPKQPVQLVYLGNEGLDLMHVT